MNKYTAAISLIFLTVYTTILGLTLEEIRQYEYQFLQKILDGCTIVIKPPRVYTQEELFFLSEGRYCPDKAEQTSQNDVSERIFDFKSPYADDNAHAPMQWHIDHQAPPMPYDFVPTPSPSQHQCYLTIQQKPTTEPNRCIQQQINHARNSVVQRMQLFATMQQFNGADFLNFIFGTSFTDHTSAQELKNFIYDHTQQYRYAPLNYMKYRLC